MNNHTAEAKGKETLPHSLDGQSHEVWLDWLRGGAAIIVLITHVRRAYFAPWDALDASSRNFWSYLFFCISRLGPEAVTVFFVLSGYLVGGRALMKAHEKQFSLAEYMIARIARLYTVLLPALALTALCDFQKGGWNRITNGWQNLIINIGFLQRIIGDTYGSNNPLWSLSYEWWFYVFFGFILNSYSGSALHRYTRWLLSVPVFILLAILMWPHILSMFPIWLLGVLASTLPVFRNKTISVITVISFVAGIGISTKLENLLGSYTLGIATAALICVLRQRSASASSRKWGQAIAAISFSLYATHFPQCELLRRVFFPHFQVSIHLSDWLSVTVITVVLVIFSAIFWWAFEKHTPKVRAFLSKLLIRQHQRAERVN